MKIHSRRSHASGCQFKLGINDIAILKHGNNLKTLESEGNTALISFMSSTD